MEKFEIITGKNNVCTAVQTGEKNTESILNGIYAKKRTGTC